MKKHLLIVAGCMNTGGLEKQLLNLAENLDSSKYDIDFTSDQEEADYKDVIQRNGWGYVFLPSTRDAGILRYIKELYCLLKNNKYDIVHSHELFHSGLVMFVAWVVGIKKRIAHSHSTNDDSAHAGITKKIYHHIMRWMINTFATDRVACSSEAGIYLFGKRSKKKFCVVWNTVDTDKFIRSNEGIDTKRTFKRIIHVGRFVELKNQKFILRIAEEMKTRDSAYIFTFVGDGETLTENKQYADAHELNGITEFLGTREDIPDLLHVSDVFILPSLFEGMPLSLIEAQAAGLPCVVSADITDEVDFGLGLIERIRLNQPVSSWVKGIEDALSKPKCSKEAILNAIKEKGFDNRDYARKMELLYSNDC